MLSNLALKAYVWATNKRAELEQEEGQTLIEYTLIIGVVVVAIFGAMMLTGLDGAISGAIASLVGVFTTDPFAE
jgi:Flp pilus assembly pilin Flp